jgi:hypothetical protein
LAGSGKAGRQEGSFQGSWTLGRLSASLLS